MKIIKSITAAAKGRPAFSPTVEVRGETIHWNEFEFSFGARKRVIPEGEFKAEYDPMLNVTYYLCVGLNTGARVVVEYEGLTEELYSDSEPSDWVLKAFVPCSERRERVIEYKQVVMKPDQWSENPAAL